MTSPDPQRRLPHRPVPLPALEAQLRRPGRDAGDGRRRGRRHPPRLQAQAQQLRPRRRHRAARRAATASASSIPRCAPSSSRARRTACSAPAPTSSCSGCRATRGRSTSASSPTRRATASRTRAGTPGSKFIAAVNGTCAGGGYELALACDEILLVDDRSSAVSLPEVPLLGVLPGTGGLTRLTDKRKVRHDLADIFCTTTEGVRGQRAKDWRLVDAIAEDLRSSRQAVQRARARSSPQASDRPADAQGVDADAARARRSSADATRLRARRACAIDRARRARRRSRCARPTAAQPADIAGIEAAGAGVVAARDGARARRRDPVAAHQRARHRHLAAARPRAMPPRCSPCDATLCGAPRPLVRARDDRPAAPHARAARRLVAHAVRADRAGLVLRRHAARARARRRPQLHARAAGRRSAGADAARCPRLNFGAYPLVNGQSRLARRFYDEAAPLDAARAALGRALDADAGARARPRHRGAGRHRLGRRGAHRARGAREPVARRADRHGGQPALRRHRDDGDARSSAGCPRGRTGSSSARTPSARRARSRSTARATRPRSTSGPRLSGAH